MSEQRPPRDREPGDVAEDESAGPIVVLPIEDSIDLHTFDPKEVDDVVDSYLHAAWEKGFQEVRLIHGRGKGVQRARIRAVLARDPRVQAFGDAPGHRGGWGATLVWLKPRP